LVPRRSDSRNEMPREEIVKEIGDKVGTMMSVIMMTRGSQRSSMTDCV
jgi:hypothetical protein